MIKLELDVFQMMCSPMYNIGVHLFKQNNLDFDKFIEYVLHRAKYKSIKPNFNGIFKSEIKVLNYYLTIEYLKFHFIERNVIHIKYNHFNVMYFELENYGKKINKMKHYEDHFPKSSYNMLYEDYIIPKFKGSFKNRLKELFNKI